jgi:NosR/NirI family nitrous oxide reductase transcriptional regulator
MQIRYNKSHNRQQHALQQLIQQFLLCLLLGCISQPSLSEQQATSKQLIQQIFPSATVVADKDMQQAVPVWVVYQLNEVIGYAFESNDMVNLPGFSGERINLLIGIDTQGVINGLRLLHHHEPIFLHGLGEQPLLEFIQQYSLHSIAERFIIDSKADSSVAGNTAYFDGVTKATVSIIIANDTIVNSALKVARAKLAEFAKSPPALLKTDYYEPLAWPELLSSQLVKHWSLNRQQLEQQLGSSLDAYPAAPFELMDEDQQPLVDLYYSYLNPPSIGINLLGEDRYRELMSRMEPGDHALMVLSANDYPYLGEDFKAGTVPANISLIQNGVPISIRDSNYYQLDQLSLNTGSVTPQAVDIFRIRPQAGFDPSTAMQLQLKVELSKNHLVKDSALFSDDYLLPTRFFDPVSLDDNASPSPLWVRIWQSRSVQIIILLIGLAAITVAFAKQHTLTKNHRLFHRFRWLALTFTLFFIGFYAQGQLSVVNIFTVLLALFKGFSIDVFLLDPIIFILWLYTFISLFLVGRGLFCGWLCPFGALQEMLSWVAKKLRIRSIKVPNQLHRRLLKIKYLILLVLVALTFYSLTAAEKAAEVEPFKTAITLLFVRHWPFVLYAVLLLTAGLYIHKFYCRYLCPLGAGLAILGYFKVFKLLDRRKECGSPCQLCHNHCEIDAIKKNGDIDYEECIQCLECIVIIHDPQQCAPAKLALKKSAQPRKTSEAVIASAS